MPSYVALLRGINVGGNRKLPMAELVKLFVGAGCSDVKTYIQSGNVVFESTPTAAIKIPKAVGQGIQKKYGFDVEIVIRSAAELSAVVKMNPLLKAGVDPKTLHVSFLSGKPSAAQVASLDPDRSPGDSFKLLGSEIYLLLPHGVARTKLTNQYFDSKLGVTSTLRNWNTVLALLEMTK